MFLGHPVVLQLGLLLLGLQPNSRLLDGMLLTETVFYKRKNNLVASQVFISSRMAR